MVYGPGFGVLTNSKIQAAVEEVKIVYVLILMSQQTYSTNLIPLPRLEKLFSKKRICGH